MYGCTKVILFFKGNVRGEGHYKKHHKSFPDIHKVLYCLALLDYIHSEYKHYVTLEAL